MSVGAEMIWGALDWLRRLSRGITPPQRTRRDDLEAQTRSQLLILAKEAGILGRHRMSKSELVTSLMPMESPVKPPVDALMDSIREPVAGKRGGDVAGNMGPGVDSGRENTGLRKGPPPVEPETPERVVQAPDQTWSPREVPDQALSLQGVPDQALPPQEEVAELPRDYGCPRLTLMEVEPCRVHVYWEIGPRDREAALERLGKRAGRVDWVLRLYDVTYIDFDGTNAHSYFDVTVDTVVSNWYVDLWSGDKAYCAEVGPRASDGRFVPVCRSNFVNVPRGEPSPRYEPAWLTVEDGFHEMERVPEPAPEDCPKPYPATTSRGQDDEKGDGAWPEPAAGATLGQLAVAQDGGDGVSAQSRFAGGGQAQGHGQEIWAARSDAISAESCGSGSSAAELPVEQARDDQHLPWVETQGTAPASATMHPDGGDGVSSDVSGVGSMRVREPIEGGWGGEQPAQETPGSGAATDTPACVQEESGQFSRVSSADVRERYAVLLTGSPPTARLIRDPAGGSTGPGLDPASLQFRIEEGRPVSTSSEGVSSFGSGGSWDVAQRDAKSAIDLKLNADVVISGRAQPGQTVQVNGRWLKVNADGTFSMRLALPVIKDYTEDLKK